MKKIKEALCVVGWCGLQYALGIALTIILTVEVAATLIFLKFRRRRIQAEMAKAV